MDRSYNNSRQDVNGLNEQAYRRLYEEIRHQVYRDAHREGYEEGRHDGYNLGYEDAVKDHQHNESAAKEKHYSDMHWHGKKSKSWTWI